MEQQQNGREESSLQHRETDQAEMGESPEAANGMATTQEQVSDMYKMGTIEDKSTTR